MRDVNLETIIGTLSWYKMHPLNGYNLIRAKRKLLRRRKGVYESFSGRRNCRMLGKIDHGFIVHLHSIDPRPLVFPRDRCAESKKGRPQCRCIQAWKNGGLIQWNAAVNFEMSETSWQMGKHLVNFDLENHPKARFIRLALWFKTNQVLRTTSQVSTNLVRNSCQEYSLDMHWLREESGKEIFLVADMERVRNPWSKAQCKGSDNADKW